MPNGQPPLPRNWQKFPVGNITRIKREQRRMRGALAKVRAWLREEFDAIPRRQVTANAAGITVNAYEYLIDLPELQRIIEELSRRLGDLPADRLADAVEAAYRQGTGDEVVNLAAIMDDYTRTITQVLQSDPWQRRVALVRARVFEEMRGFEGDTARDLGRVLSQAVQDGLNPMDVKRTISERFGVSMSRAERISRTEIAGAYRRARWDEDADANQRLGIKTGMLWISALLPTTRETHAALSGEVVDQDFIREFYSRDGNAIHCNCSQISVLLDDDGSVATPGIVDRVRQAKPQTGESPLVNANDVAELYGTPCKLQSNMKQVEV